VLKLGNLDLSEKLAVDWCFHLQRLVNVWWVRIMSKIRQLPYAPSFFLAFVIRSFDDSDLFFHPSDSCGRQCTQLCVYGKHIYLFR